MEKTVLGSFETFLIKDSPLHVSLFDHLKTLWNDFKRDIFPGPQPVSIERKHFETLQNNMYWVCEKTDGYRYLFVCFYFDNKPYCFLINRKKDIYLLNTRFMTSAYNGTILDGEFIEINGTFKYLVYDSTIVCGENTTHLNHSERLLKCKPLIDFIQYCPFTMEMKLFYPLKQMKDYVQRVVPKLQHKTDGFIFTPENEPVKSGTHYTMFKWKPLESNTVDFHIERNKNKHKKKHFPFILKVKNHNSLVALLNETLVVNDMSILQGLNDDNSLIVECKYIHNNTWEAILVRTDKNHPNNMLTFEKTKLNIEENIQLTEFF
jgi:hypothetical protein